MMEQVAVARLSELKDGDYKVYAVDGFEVGVFRVGDKVVAYRNECPHAGGPVCQGKIFHQIEEVLTPDMKSAGLRHSKRRNVVCPWHGYEFDIETGRHPGDPNMRLTPVEIAVRDGDILVAIEERWMNG
jgi:nitrite reductase/ring-hydroxylating ferredoxin subunit